LSGGSITQYSPYSGCKGVRSGQKWIYLQRNQLLCSKITKPVRGSFINDHPLSPQYDNLVSTHQLLHNLYCRIFSIYLLCSLSCRPVILLTMLALSSQSVISNIRRKTWDSTAFITFKDFYLPCRFNVYTFTFMGLPGYICAFISNLVSLLPVSVPKTPKDPIALFSNVVIYASHSYAWHLTNYQLLVSKRNIGC
jgi:hypothetical protein